jgi:ribosome-associated heat shock protein Hsp15
MSVEQVRIDKWLWAARFFKTRTLAAAAVENGRVRIDRERVKPARNVHCGELLQIDNGSTEWEVAVRALSDKRGSAAVAQGLYEETEESVRKRQQQAERRKLFHEPSLEIKGRPTKRDRRMLDRTR